MDPNLYSEIKASIKQRLHIDLASYKDEQMKRRLDSWLIRVRANTWDDYFALLSDDAAELERFRGYLTINVTEFFRDPNRWESLRRDLLPALVNEARPRPGGLRFWSAGCSTGAEPYSLAILMNELAPRQEHTILATDLDRGALRTARARGPFMENDLRNLDPARRERYVTASAPFFVRESLQRNVRFEEHDLLGSRFERDFDLIVCRNVVIYFTAEAKESLYARFGQALRPGGVLFMGGTEIISGPGRFGLQNVGISFYRKTG